MKRDADHGIESRETGSYAIKRAWEIADQRNAEGPHPAGGEWIPTRAIEVRRALLPRDEVAPAEVVEAYAQAWDRLPPIIVQGGTFVLIDGYHRLAAAPLRASDVIRAVQLEMPDDMLADAAVRENVGHGLRLTAVERQKAAQGMLKRHPDWSNIRVAEWTGSSERTVARLREQLLARHEIAPATHRVSRDGQVQPVHSAPKVVPLAPPYDPQSLQPAQSNDRESSPKRSPSRSFDPGREAPEPSSEDPAAGDSPECDRCHHIEMAHQFAGGCRGQTASGGRLRSCGCRAYITVGVMEDAPEPIIDHSRDAELARIAQAWFEVAGTIEAGEWPELLRRWPSAWTAAMRGVDETARVVEAIRLAAVTA